VLVQHCASGASRALTGTLLLPERLLYSASPPFNSCWSAEGTMLRSGRLHKLLSIFRLLATR